MRKVNQTHGLSCLFFLVPLLALLLTGCTLPIENTKSGAQLSSYRKVYFVNDKSSDPRAVFPRVASRLKKAGFDVTVVDPTSGPQVNLQGSGFVISSDGYILTCAHVVEGYTNATVWVQGARYSCIVSRCDTNLDLALLKIRDTHPSFRALSLKFGHDYSLGENVFTMGFPLADVLGVSPRLNNGLVSAKVGMNDDTNFVQISVPVQPGNSGGPLLTPDGRAIGVIVATLNPFNAILTGGGLPQNVNFAIKLSSINKFLTDSNIPGSTNQITAQNFDEAEKAVALVFCGDVSDEELKQPALVCVCNYRSFFDLYWRFQKVEIDFYDPKTGSTVFAAGQQIDTLVTENAELDGIFGLVSAKFFPGKPNPFK